MKPQDINNTIEDIKSMEDIAEIEINNIEVDLE